MIKIKHQLKTIAKKISKHFNPRSASDGFSLVEIAIVLIIIGLILGGVMKGFQLIDSAKIRSISSQINSYKVATVMFKEKYNALPGDFNRASFELAGNAINGPGQGFIDGEGFRPGSSSSLFWQHLKLSGLIDDGSINENDPSGNFYPTTKLGGFISVTYRPRGLPGHWFVVADKMGSSAVPLLTPGQAHELDKLMDSGNPKTGNLRSFESQNSNSSIGSKCLKSNGAYNLDNKDPACMVYIKM